MENVFFVADYKVEGVSQYASINDVVEYISSLKVIGIDIETTRKYKRGEYNEDVYRGGLDPYLTNIVMLQLGDLHRQYVIDVRRFTKEDLAPILSILDYNKNIVLVGANLKFEAKHLKHNYGINLHSIFDVMLAEICLYNGVNGGVGLADLAERYLGVSKKKEESLFEDSITKKITLDDRLLEEENYITPFDIADDFRIDKSTRLQFLSVGDKPFTATQILYGADDIIFPVLIRERQLLGRMLPDNTLYKPLNWFKIENHYCLVLADMELNGMKIDRNKWGELHDNNYIKYQEREDLLVNWIVKNFPEYSVGNNDLFTGKPVCTIKWSSSKQVVNLFRSLNICPRAYSKQTKKVEFTVGAVELLRTLPNHLKMSYEKDKDVEITDLDSLKLAYLLYKKAEQSITTFGKKWLKYVHPITGRCHSSYRQILNTGRISSTNPNLQNITGGLYRDCFIADEDTIIINSDYSANEARVLAEVSKDPFLINFFVKGDEYFGEDFHSFTATKVFSALMQDPDLKVPPKEIKDAEGNDIKNKEFTSEHNMMRTNAKQYTFGMAFGKTAETFSKDLGISIEEAESIFNSYLEAFPGLADYFKEAENNAQTKSYITIDEKSGATWFCPFFDEINSLYQQAWSYFPEDYKDLTRKDKESAKQMLYKEKPFVKDFFRQAGRLRSSLKNKFQNYPIQGKAAQMMKFAMCMLRKAYIENNWTDFKLISNVHDEVLVECKLENGNKYGDKLKECLEKAGAYISPVVPQKANYILSNKWEH